MSSRPSPSECILSKMVTSNRRNLVTPSFVTSVAGFLPDPTPEPSVSPSYAPTLYPRPFGKSGKSSSEKSGKSTKTLKYSGSKTGKSAKSVDKDDYQGLFGDYKRATNPFFQQGFEVSYKKSTASRTRGIWFSIVIAVAVSMFSMFIIGL